MDTVVIFASPIWVNLLLFVPVGFFLYWKRHPFDFHKRDLFLPSVFGIAFGFIEAAYVIYLRAATDLLPGYHGTLADVQNQAVDIIYNQQMLLEKLPSSLYTVELIREAGTMIMLISFALVAAKKYKERIAIFLWVFALRDIFYYVSLYFTVRWPESISTIDVLFLIPQPWFSYVWFPVLVSLFTLGAIFFNTKRS